jgi:hypothetical protein
MTLLYVIGTLVLVFAPLAYIAVIVRRRKP